MKILIIDGQGGKMGKSIIEKIIATNINCQLYAIGTNSIATVSMVKAGAHFGATGENPIVVNAKDADVIIGPVGVVIADSLLGEVTPLMSVAIGQSRAKKLLIPVNKCNNIIIGVDNLGIGEMCDIVIDKLKQILN